MVGRTGIAGYSGSGKTTVARLYAAAGAVVIDADAEAKKVIAEDGEVVSRLTEVFGETVMGSSGINFGALGRIVFRSKEQLLRYNGIVHPPVLSALRALFDREKNNEIILDAALIPLWGIESWFDRCVWVHASHAVRLSRVAFKRKDLDAGSLRDRLRIQEEIMKEPSGDRWVRLPNEGNPEELAHAVIGLRGRRPDSA